MSFWTAKTKEGGNALVEIIDEGEKLNASPGGNLYSVYQTKFRIHREEVCYNQVDKILADMGFNGPTEFRMSEDDAYLSSIGIDVNTLTEAGE